MEMSEVMNNIDNSNPHVTTSDIDEDDLIKAFKDLNLTDVDSLLLSCNSYQSRQNIIKKKLSEGFLLLTRSHTSINNCRSDIDPTITLLLNDTDGLFTINTQTIESKNESLYMFNGLPPRALRAAQERFLEALQEVVAAVNDIHAINACIQKCS